MENTECDSYIRYVRQNFNPVLTTEAERVISSYYQHQRRSASPNAGDRSLPMFLGCLPPICMYGFISVSTVWHAFM
jgi:hypothetical protein